MKINRNLFKNKDYFVEEDLDFSNETFDPNHIRQIGKTHVKITGNDYDDFLVLDFKIKSDVIGVCSYSLEDVPLTVKVDASLSFTYEEEDEETIHIDNPIFDVDEYILDLIIAEVPMKLVKKGAKLPSSGAGYRVLSEDEYNKEQEEKVDPRWAALDNIDLD